VTTAFPLAWPDGWPRTPAKDRRSWYQLKMHFDTARTKLIDELRRMGVSSLVISCNLALRRDGLHSTQGADNRAEDPGVAVYFTLHDRPMVMASDLYEATSSNLRSVGLAIEHLRGLERHGGGHMMNRAFAGFTALPPPGGQQETAVDWRKELDITKPMEALGKATCLVICEANYRSKAKNAHADVGGSNEAMIRLNAAIALARKELA
jgi:hypothetical protein